VWAPVQHPGELYDDPQVIANGYLPEAVLNDGSRAQLVANPVQFDEQPFEVSGAPECGQNTEEVLLELGLEWDDLVRLKAEKAIL
jgi:crotonobetainyl-CoA:carnitine CoA-transferase CaiB-like acyl-CoA transferase